MSRPRSQIVRTFRDRREAGERLAEALGDLPPDALILAIPRGGVVVARAVAEITGRPLDVLVAHKLGAPGNPELAIGAIGPDGSPVIDETVIAALEGVPSDYIEDEARHQGGEIERRVRLYRGDRGPLAVSGRTCVVVDDGIATGSTVRASMVWLRRKGASSIVLAVPVAPRDTMARLGALADRVVCLLEPRTFLAVGQWYDHFGQVTDDEVVRALAQTP